MQTLLGPLWVPRDPRVGQYDLWLFIIHVRSISGQFGPFQRIIGSACWFCQLGRHNTDFRTIDEIIIGWISSCEIRKTVFTESVNYNTPRFQVIYLMNGIFVSIVTVSAVTLFRIIWNRSKCSPWGLLGTHRGPKRVHLSYLAEINMRSLWCSGRVQMALKYVSHI